MESPLNIINIFESLNPKPPYECHSIRRNPDLIKLEYEEPPLFREDYEEYIMTSGQKVYQREFTIDGDWYEDDSYDEIQIISREEWEELPIQSTGKLATFHKEINKKVWEARGNGINHYHTWHEPVYHLPDMMEKIAIPQLELRRPTLDNL